MSTKPIPVPKWWKNTYFWIAGILLIVGIIGLPFLGGEKAIRDPGQKDEHFLVLIYFAGAVIMFVNGLISHKQTVIHYEEQQSSPQGEE